MKYGDVYRDANDGELLMVIVKTHEHEGGEPIYSALLIDVDPPWVTVVAEDFLGTTSKWELL